MPAKIHVERMMYRNSVSVPGESAASYALVKLIPSSDASNVPLGLNLGLVLDVSGSMYEEDGTGKSRLQRIQDAALAAIRKLQPDDTLAVVAFAHNAQVVLPATSLQNRQNVEEVIERIDLFDVDPGGTSMDQGIALGLAEVEKSAGPGRLSQLLVLTDGETSGEQVCRQLAQQAAEKKIHFTVMGIGTEWNASLLKDLARLAEGKWYYIDVDQAQEAARVFLEEFEHLAATAFANVQMHLQPIKDVRIKRVRQVVPEIKELELTEPEERHLVAALGTLERDKPSRYILDLSLPRRPDGNYVLLQLEVSYDLRSGRRESTGKVPLQVQYSESGQGYVNAEVARHIDEVQIYELNKNLQQAIVSNDQAEAQRVAETISRKGELLGARAAKKTMLARQVLQELHVGGRVSRKTQLAVDDAARLAEEMPLPASEPAAAS
jgi:Ca-activated chloride channel family protein